MNRFLSALLILCFTCYGSVQSQSSSDQPFARFPAVSPDGSQVAFSWQGDIWVMPATGGTARRLTLHPAYEGYPKWSPDGSKIAFISDRFGNDDLFVMDADGGRPRQITYHSTDDELTGWTADNRLIFTTERNYNEVEWEPEIQTVSANGGTPNRFFDAFGMMASMSADGRYLVFVRGYGKEYRLDYRGTANKNLWVYDTQNNNYNQLTDFMGNDMYPAFAGAHTLFFLSERSGDHNLYKVDFENGNFSGKPEQITHFSGDGIRYFSVSDAGKTIVFERQTGLYKLNVASGQSNAMQVDVTHDARHDDIVRKTFKEDGEEYALSPDGKYLALVIRGEVFIKQNDPQKSRSVKLTDDPFRDRDVAFLNDSTLILSSDRNGQYDFYSIRSSDPEETNLYKSLHHKTTRMTETEEDERDAVVAPDKSKIAYRLGRGQLVVANIKDGRTLGAKTTLLDGWATPDGVSWSPDSKWLAYSLADLDFNSEIYIHPADNSRKPVNVSMHPRPDSDPVWSPDGSKLAFLSSRNNGDEDVWFAWLKKEDWQRTQLGREQSKDEEEETKAEKDSSKTPKVAIDFDGLYKRLQQVTALPGNESDIAISKHGDTFYFVTNRNSRQSYRADQDLHQVKWDGSEMKTLTHNDLSPYGLQLNSKLHAIYMGRRGGHLARYNLKKDKLEQLPFTASMEINYPAERKQIFEEAWRALNHGYYDPDFHGHNWQKMHDKYKPWALKASTEHDFSDVMNMMLGELNSSHMGFYGSDRTETQSLHTGLLGVRIQPLNEGVKVTHVVPESPADRELSRLYPDDIITAVNGEKVTGNENFYKLLEGTVDNPTSLSVRGAEGKTREVVIEPTRSLNRERYDEWVQDRRKLTEKYSNGKLGYIHVQGMNWPSFERFERALVAAGQGKEGLVIDVRYNGGGWITDYLLTVLEYKQHAFTIPRGATDNLKANKQKFRNHYPFGERLPLSSWTRPSIAMANQNSYSNAEIFAHAYKQLNLGTLVGEPTFGAVISTGGVGLMGGSYVRLPFRGWYVKNSNENMEHGPAVPDITVENAPDYRTKGDAQLKRAVEELLSQIRQ